MSNSAAKENKPYASVKDRKSAYWAGFRHGAGAPAWVLFAGMIGFGAMGRSTGMDIWFTTAVTFSMFALPGQVVFVEMMSMGATGLAAALAVAFTATRFLTMTLTIFPQMHPKHRNKSNLVAVHVLAMSSWASCMKEFPHIKQEYRYAFYIGLGMACWVIAVPGTAIGYLIAGFVPKAVTYGLLFINPLFFLLTFVDVVLPMNRLAIFMGGLVGTFLYLYLPSESLLIAGLGCGTFAYLIDLYWRRRNRTMIEKGGRS
jgi:predicted branched-subunit amino acid permease